LARSISRCRCPGPIAINSPAGLSGAGSISSARFSAFSAASASKIAAFARRRLSSRNSTERRTSQAITQINKRGASITARIINQSEKPIRLPAASKTEIQITDAASANHQTFAGELERA